MVDPDDSSVPRPQTLKLYRKKHAPWAVALAIAVMIGAIAFAVYAIYSATLPPDTPVVYPAR
jgi:hypothetical protein